MEMTMRLPANYNLMTEQEMTYTEGGAFDWGVATTVAAGVLDVAVRAAVIVNWLDLLSGARNWYAANKTGDLLTDAENSVEAWLDYTTSSVWNCCRSILATMTAVSGVVPIGGVTVPYGPIVTGLAFLTVI